jgi:MFS family permease
MGILTLAEDRPTPLSVYNWRVYVLAIVASCGSNMIGYTSAFIGTTITLDSFKKEFGIDQKSAEERNLISENIVSLFIAGAFFGALLTYLLSHWVGRKWCLAIASATFTLGAGLQCGADSGTGLGILYAGRVLSGLGTGVASNIIPIYLSELAPPAIRGRLVGLYELGWQIGGLVGFWINVSKTQSLHLYSDTDASSTVSRNTCLKAINNGSSPSLFKSSHLAYSSSAPCGFESHRDGCS